MRSLAEGLPAWVWVESLPSGDGTLTLSGDAAHHVARVCRVRPGEAVTLTDGRGRVAEAEVLASRGDPLLRVIRSLNVAEPAARVLMLGSPEGERGDWLIEKLTELGATHLRLIDSERSSWEAAERRTARWSRLMRAALQQSCRAWLPELSGPMPLEESWAAAPGDAAMWLADVSGDPAAGHALDGAQAQLGAIGAAKGFSPRERDMFAARGFRPIRLSSGRLRSETASLAMAAWWAASDPANSPERS